MQILTDFFAQFKKKYYLCAVFDTNIKMKENNIPIVDCPYGDYMIGDASGKLMNEYGRFFGTRNCPRNN